LSEQVASDRERLHRAPDDWPAWWRAGGDRELRCILMTAWDPIGVGDTPEAWDEYEHYAPGIAHRLRDANSRDDGTASVTDYLNHVERDFMGVERDERRRTNFYLAEQLVAWHEWSFKRGADPHRSGSTALSGPRRRERLM
jgi:hypothetical protein